jgi:adenylate kinase family enzyme
VGSPREAINQATVSDDSGASPQGGDGGLRTWVVGVAGAGKTTFARRLATVVDATHIQLDDLFWLPEWKIRDDEDFLRAIAGEMASGDWVVDGQYPQAVEEYLMSANILVWVDPPFWRSYQRLVRRTLHRLWRRERFCGDNYESFGSVFGRKSMLWLALRYHRDQRRKISAICESFAEGGKTVVHARGSVLDALMTQPTALSSLHGKPIREI